MSPTEQDVTGSAIGRIHEDEDLISRCKRSFVPVCIPIDKESVFANKEKSPLKLHPFKIDIGVEPT